MFELNLERVRANARASTTEDLLDRVTVYRDGMEPEALAIIEEELRQRGVSAGEMVDHLDQRGEVLQDAEGVALKCAKCSRPAVVRRWRLVRLWGIVPVLPRRVALCEDHAG